jgi:RNAse (barnase) inhibitor barstar
MMRDLSKFVFDYRPSESQDDFIAHVPHRLSSRDDLFKVLRRELLLPDYFGENWDALSECLRDLSWITNRRVVIVHEDLPRLDNQTLSTYLDVLLKSAQDWKPEEDHELLVVFPENARAAVLGTIEKDKKRGRDS